MLSQRGINVWFKILERFFCEFNSICFCENVNFQRFNVIFLILLRNLSNQNKVTQFYSQGDHIRLDSIQWYDQGKYSPEVVNIYICDQIKTNQYDQTFYIRKKQNSEYSEDFFLKKRQKRSYIFWKENNRKKFLQQTQTILLKEPL